MAIFFGNFRVITNGEINEMWKLNRLAVIVKKAVGLCMLNNQTVFKCINKIFL